MKDVARPDIKPAFADRNIPVVFATDENYLPYVKVAVNSAVANAAGSSLDILILHSGIDGGSIRAFIARYAGLERVSVRFVDVSGGLAGSRLAEFERVDRLPVSTCYRLLIPDILTAYDKLIYLNVDVAACRDMGELYAIDLGESYFAAAKDVVHSKNPEYLAWAAGWGFTDWSGYANTGVLVMNLGQFRREPILDGLLKVVLEAAKWLCDQDALNFVCKGRIAPLDPRWNVQLGDYCIKEQIALTGDEMWIAHFSGGQKPWKRPAHRYAHLWWRHVDPSDVFRLWAQAWGDALVLPGTGAPKVSVVMPAFNARLYLSEALASVLMQKEIPEIEVVCIDDGSTDDSAEILEFWEKRDPRLHVVRQKNQGAGVARNAGLDVAKGEYIFFLDADDRLSSGTALRQAYEQAQEDNLDILIADGSVMSESGELERRAAYLCKKLVPEERVFAPDALGANLYAIAFMAPGAKLFRRKFIEEKNLRFPALKRSEDFPMVQLALSLAERLGVMAQPLFCRRTGVATSLESTKDEAPLAFAEAERIFRLSLKERGLLDRFACAADACFLVNIAYNLRKVKRFSSFRSIALYCAENFSKLRAGAEALSQAFVADSCKLVEDAAAAANDMDGLADVFADVQSGKPGKVSGDAKQKSAVAKRAAEKEKPWRRTLALLNRNPPPRPESPSISVIIPVYNAEKYINDCLASLFTEGSPSDIEIICVDDGSTDGSLELLRRWAKAAHNIRIVEQENRGPGAARNTGLALARGEYVYFLDSDDWVEFRAFGRLLDVARQEKPDQVLFAAEVHLDDESGDVQSGADIARYARMAMTYNVPDDVADRPMSGVDMAIALMERRNFNVLATVRLIRRETLVDSGILFPPGVFHEDEFFTAALYTVSRKVVAVREKCFHRRFRPGSIMTARDNAVEHLRGCLTVARLIDEFAKARFAEGSREMEFLCARMRVVENIILGYSRSITLGMLPPERRNGVLHDIFADDQAVRHVDLAFKSGVKAADVERVERDAAQRKAAEMRAERDAQRETALQKIAAAQAERDAARRKAAEMRAERDAAREKVSAARSERDAARRKMAEMRTERDEARQKAAFMRDARDAARQQLLHMRDLRDAAVADAKNRQRVIDALREAVS